MRLLVKVVNVVACLGLFTYLLAEAKKTWSLYGEYTIMTLLCSVFLYGAICGAICYGINYLIERRFKE